LTTTTISGRNLRERPLGHGAMSVVDLARDIELDRDVALKRLAENLARDDELRARFQREARLAARLAHPNVVHIYDVGVDEDGRPFIAMEFVDGETLAELLARRGPLPPDEVSALGVQACRALAAAHAAGRAPRRQAAELILRRDGVLKLGDFGVAFGLEGTRLTVAGTVLGTAAYLAPEQARGEEVTAAADIYGLGAVLYELLTGRRPRAPGTLSKRGESEAIPMTIQREAKLAQIVMLPRLDADDRPLSAAEVGASSPRHARSADTGTPRIRRPRDRDRCRRRARASGPRCCSPRRPSSRSLRAVWPRS
jgi:serine/threonine protein kinase